MVLINDFKKIVKVIQWREPSIKIVFNEEYLKSLQFLNYNAKLNIIHAVLKTCQMKTLLAVLKPYIITRGSVIYKIIVDIIETEIKNASAVMKKYEEKYGESVSHTYLYCDDFKSEFWSCLANFYQFFHQMRWKKDKRRGLKSPRL